METNSIDKIKEPQNAAVPFHVNQIDEAKKKFKDENSTWIKQFLEIDKDNKTLARLARELQQLQDAHLMSQIDKKFAKLTKEIKAFADRIKGEKKIKDSKEGVKRFAELVLRTANKLLMRNHEK